MLPASGNEYHAKASEEVIISAGSVASPQLLGTSGIGNPAVLEAAKISVRVANINVGEHVQDHMMTATISEFEPSIPTQDDPRTNPNLAAAADEQYVASQSGPRTGLPGLFYYLSLSYFIPADELTPANALRFRRLFGTQRLGSVEYIFDLGNWSPFYMAELVKKYATLLQILQYVDFVHDNIWYLPLRKAPSIMRGLLESEGVGDPSEKFSSA
ncbi:hypothetical protein LTR56_024814 [Elasticomyces elasticus]|nr:hypothetical protein LTR56_024814 [Elasticomyces elasticus]KAK3621795.1 hypothetical protein LTR22_025058 [Elasticomyces elasticus]KAK4906630.1 hypothetical protein LTR49_024243 [Elasticomyces elasticus]